MIQDYIMSFVVILFSYSLIPQIIKVYKNKSAKDLSWQLIGFTTFGLLVMSITLLTLKFYWTSLLDLTTALLWLSLFIAKIIFRKK